jgi:hypothetical protein
MMPGLRKAVQSLHTEVQKGREPNGNLNQILARENLFFDNDGMHPICRIDIDRHGFLPGRDS